MIKNSKRKYYIKAVLWFGVAFLLLPTSTIECVYTPGGERHVSIQPASLLEKLTGLAFCVPCSTSIVSPLFTLAPVMEIVAGIAAFIFGVQEVCKIREKK